MKRKHSHSEVREALENMRIEQFEADFQNSLQDAKISPIFGAKERTPKNLERILRILSLEKSRKKAMIGTQGPAG